MTTPVTSIVVPTIDSLPTTPREAAVFIWQHQDKLNAISHPQGRGTLAIGNLSLTGENGEENKAIQAGAVFDYHLALLAETNELLENFYWKHWSKEAKEGKRWGMLAPDSVAGPGSTQNVRLEIIDLVFFTVSLLQVFGLSESQWANAWGDATAWEGVSKDNLLTVPTRDEAPKLMAQALELLTLVGQRPYCGKDFTEAATGYSYSQALSNKAEATSTVLGIITSLIGVAKSSGLDWQKTLELYAKKLIVNYERQIRGRKQVGDTQAELENNRVQ